MMAIMASCLIGDNMINFELVIYLFVAYIIQAIICLIIAKKERDAVCFYIGLIPCIQSIALFIYFLELTRIDVAFANLIKWIERK